MEKIPIREQGLVGTLFRRGNPSSAVLVLGGSSGGLNEERAQYVAESGFAGMALAYFGLASLPPRLEQIDLEYFETAIERLQREAGIEKIGIWGVSRGAELALILGTLFPQKIHAIAAHVPSSVVYGSFEPISSPVWLYQGKPFAPNAPFSYGSKGLGECEQTAIAATPSFLKGMEDVSAFSASAIPVEKIQCPLLLISAEEDQMWPSTVFAEQIIDRLSTYKSPIFRSHLRYPGVGHAPSKGIVGLHPMMKRWFAYGGNPKDNAFAAKDWTDQTILFFKERL